MQSNSLPKLERILPNSVWERFAERFEKATGLGVAALDAEGRPLPARGDLQPLCTRGQGGEREACLAFYRKLALQAARGEDVLLFRCPGGGLVFAAPVRFASAAGAPELILVGGPAQPPAQASAAPAPGAPSPLPVLEPRRLLEVARLAQWTLRVVVQGNRQRAEHGRRQSQVMTLFDVVADLTQAASGHEVFALALNTLGVLFEVGDAALFLYDPGAEAYRMHTAMGGLEKTLASWTFAPDDPLRERLSRPGGAARFDDVHDLARLGLPEEVESLSLFALRGTPEPLGLLALLNTSLSPQDEQIVRGFAGQLSLTLENRRLREALGGKSVELQSVQETSRRFLTCLQPEDLFPAILEEARKITGAQKGSLMVASNGGGELRVKSVTGLHQRVVETLRIASGKGIAGRVFASGEAMVVTNLEKDGRFQRKNRARYTTKSFLSLPISLEGRTIGVLNLADKITGAVFSEEDLRLLQTMAAQATIAIERATYYAQSLELRKISITDPLTGLLNRRYFQERLAEEVDRATRHGHSLSLIMIDIDHFKAYNDANGHPAGDRALVLVGRALRASIRTIDVVSRFGGEEFAVILPETRPEGSLEIGERIRREIESLYFAGEEALPSGRLTISLGVAGFPEDAQDMKGLIQRADRALYHAKAQGRNRMVSYTGPAPCGIQTPAAAWTKVL
ncbi:MAG: diguanylate cyclase [Proteobacteria bacterium]|nr:diguanylate cyclase [Pseudomonadota bacterium]